MARCEPFAAFNLRRAELNWPETCCGNRRSRNTRALPQIRAMPARWSCRFAFRRPDRRRVLCLPEPLLAIILLSRHLRTRTLIPMPNNAHPRVRLGHPFRDLSKLAGSGGGRAATRDFRPSSDTGCPIPALPGDADTRERRWGLFVMPLTARKAQKGIAPSRPIAAPPGSTVCEYPPSRYQ
jgi:hypothetical protein